MAKIKKINRVLVLEKFNDETVIEIGKEKKPMSLLLALGEGEQEDGSFSSRDVDTTALEVHSFTEFLERFAPTIYQGFQKDDNGGYFVYSTDPDEIPGAVPMRFDRTAFFKAAVDMYEKKAVSGQNNYEFDYSCFSKLISPETTLKEVKKKRRELQYATLKMLESKEAKNTALEKKYKKKAIGIVTDVVENYRDNPTALLCLNVADLQVKLGINSDVSGAGDSVPSLSTTKRESFRITYNSDGDIVKEKITVADLGNGTTNPALLLQTKAERAIVQLLEMKVKSIGNSSEGDAYAQKLILSTYSGNTGIIEPEDIPKLQRKYEIQKAYYKSAQDGLLKAINKIIEKMLDVKAMFDNAGSDIVAIIANCTAEDITDDDKMHEYFKNYMININNNIDQKIWFAVLPQIDDEDLVDRDSAGRVYTPEIPNAEIDETNQDNVIDVEYTSTDSEVETSSDINNDTNPWNNDDDESTSKSPLITLTSAKQIIVDLEKAKCTTFFGFKGCEKTGFKKMNKVRLNQYKDKLKDIKSRYAVFAYPNFTLMSGIQAGNIEVAPGETIENPGLYIDAPYVAVGLVLKSLDSRELEKAKFKIHKELPFPCVRFDFEDIANEFECRYKLLTNMNCEEILKYDIDLLEELDTSPFGFFFDSVGYYNGEKVRNSFVKYARNMGSGENRFFTTLVKDFIWLEMANGEQKIGVNAINSYMQKNKWNRDTYNGCVNNPLRHGEEYNYEEVNGKLRLYVKFNGVQDNDRFDDLEIVNNTEEK